MMRVFILGILMIMCGFSFAQKADIELRGSISDDDNGKALSGAKMEVFKNGVLVATETTTSNGKVNKIVLPMCTDCRYTVKFSKPGYVTKMAIVDARFDYPEELKPGIRPVQFDVSIFPSIEGIDFSFLETEAMVEYAVDSYGEVGYDEQKIKVMQKKIEDLKKKMAVQKQELAKKEAEQAKREADFNAYIAAGDAAMKQPDYDKAIGQYELALGIRPGDQPTLDKITDAKVKRDALLAQEQLNKDFGAKMQAGKDAYAKGELEKALGFYNEASSLKPLEALPKTLIKEIEDELAKRKNNEAAFKELVKAGDAAVSTEDFDTGILKYEAALKLKKDAEVEAKLAETKKLKEEKAGALAAEKANQAKYDALIAKADGEFKAATYDAAKKSYQEALKLKPDEARPTAQIAEIEKLEKALAADKAAKEKLEADYAKLMEEGKEKINQRTYPEAKEKFEAALKLKPADPAALAQLEIIKKEQEKADADAKLTAQYDGIMKDAKALMDQKKYVEAKAKYNEALKVKPLEQTPKDQIVAIDLLIQDADKAAKAEADYTKFMATGTAANDRKDYAEALSNFQKAIETKPGDSAAQAKIDAVNKAIADQNKAAADQKKFDELVAAGTQAFNAKNYDTAKLNYKNALDIKDDEAIRKKIADIDALIAKNQSEAETKAKYEAAIKEADALYNASKYAEALEKYKAAFSIQENEHPTKQIALINEKLAGQEADAAKEKQFADFVKAGDEANTAKDYTKALEKYKEAIKVKPDPAISSKIAELNTKIAEQSQNADKKARFDQKMAEGEAAYTAKNWVLAKSLFKDADLIIPAETTPEARIAEVEKRIVEESDAEATAKYQKNINDGDAFLKGDKLEEAKGQYSQALIMRPGDAYAMAQIAKIEEIKRNRLEDAAKAKKLEEDYAALIKDGERAENASNWSLAIDKYKEAGKLKPAEVVPPQKVKELEAKLGAADVAKKNEEEYKNLIAIADQLFTSEDYQGAIVSYTDALKLKPGMQHPLDKIASAKEFIKQRSSNDKDAAYKQLLADAQSKLDQKAYQEALTLYNQAKNTNPSDELPQRKIDEINQILAKSGQDAKDEEIYRDLLQKADNFFEKGEWIKAKDFYTQAYNKINREYPEQKIKECEAAIREASSASDNRQYDKIITTADEYLANKNYPKAKELYTRALGIKPSDEYPKLKLDEIDRILNPDAYVKDKPLLTDYGNPNRGTNAVDVERMLANAEAQRKFNEQQKVEQQRIDAANAESVKDTMQTEYNYETREDVIVFREDVEKSSLAADEAIDGSIDQVEEMNVEFIAIEDQRIVYNENDVQLQNQIVNNINLDLDERDESSDDDRVSYEEDVETIRVDLITENSSQDANQTDVTYEGQEYVEAYTDTRMEDDERMDIDRKNTEIHVEDNSILLINEVNSSTWDQEDVVMEVKDVVDEEIENRINHATDQDIERDESVIILENENEELVNIESNRVDDQYDVNVDQKKFVENLATETARAAEGNDIPRQEMEVFSEDQFVDAEDVSKDRITDQDNVLFKSDILIENQEIAIIENQVKSDESREGYEETVEEIYQDTDSFIDTKQNENTDDSHTTANYIDNKNEEKNASDLNADQDADALIDKTEVLIENLDKSKDLGVDEANDNLEASEDFTESIREIDITKIDEEMKNALGEEFPEGVTEEIYTINDEDGLMVSYVVRRVVVKNGAGSVYEKVQTKYGTTSYTCNGYGISEYDWQDQTENAKLIRN